MTNTLSAVNLGTVQLDEYDGPLDLLLHLVKKEELPIEKLSLAKVADQYFACLDQLTAIDFELAGEYLVIAATLLSIKSLYLTGDKKIEVPLDEEDAALDPHEELLRRLKEAAIYRDGAKALSEATQLWIDVFPSMPSKVSAVSEVVLKNHDPFSLGRALQKILNKAKDRGQEYKISVDTVTIAERMLGVLNVLKEINKVESGKRLSFEMLIDMTILQGVAERNVTTELKSLDNELTVSKIVTTFLAVLELCKRSITCVAQDNWCEEIVVWLRESEDAMESMDASVEFLEVSAG